MTGFTLPLDAVFFTISLTAHDRNGKPLARYELSPEASEVLRTYMMSEAGAAAINEATGMDHKESGT
jgi:hypothetical protein